MTARSQKFQKRGICTCLVKKIQFGKISAQRLVITAEKVWSHQWVTLTQCFHLQGNFLAKGTAGKFVVAVQRNCWRTRYFTKIRKFEKTTRVEFQLKILHF